MKRIKSLFNCVLASEIFFLLIGIMMVIRPKEALITCNFMIAIFMLITGMLIVLGKPFKKFAFKEIGMLSIILGIVLILKPEILSIVLPIVCGIYFITMGEKIDDICVFDKKCVERFFLKTYILHQ